MNTTLRRLLWLFLRLYIPFSNQCSAVLPIVQSNPWRGGAYPRRYDDAHKVDGRCSPVLSDPRILS